MNICWPFMPSDPGNTADGPLGLSPGRPLRLATGLLYSEARCCCGAGVTYRVTGKLQRRAACLQDLPRDLSLLVWTPWGSSETMRPCLQAGSRVSSSGSAACGPVHPHPDRQPRRSDRTPNPGMCPSGEGSVIWVWALRPGL